MGYLLSKVKYCGARLNLDGNADTAWPSHFGVQDNGVVYMYAGITQNAQQNVSISRRPCIVLGTSRDAHAQ